MSATNNATNNQPPCSKRPRDNEEEIDYKLVVDQLYTTLLSLRDQGLKKEFLALLDLADAVIADMFEVRYGAHNSFFTKEEVQDGCFWERLSNTSKEQMLRFFEVCDALVLTQPKDKTVVAFWKYYGKIDKIDKMCW